MCPPYRRRPCSLRSRGPPAASVCPPSRSAPGALPRSRPPRCLGVPLVPVGSASASARGPLPGPVQCCGLPAARPNHRVPPAGGCTVPRRSDYASNGAKGACAWSSLGATGPCFEPFQNGRAQARVFVVARAAPCPAAGARGRTGRLVLGLRSRHGPCIAEPLTKSAPLRARGDDPSRTGVTRRASCASAAPALKKGWHVACSRPKHTARRRSGQQIRAHWGASGEKERAAPRPAAGGPFGAEEAPNPAVLFPGPPRTKGGPP